MSASTVQAERRFQGVAVSPGIAKGKAWVHRTDEEAVPCYRVEPPKIAAELLRLEAALLQTRSQIQELQQRISSSIGDENASIFDAHLLVVDDRSLIDEVVRMIKKDRLNAESIFTTVSGRYIKTLSEINDPYLRERAVDIHDVCRRVVRNLMGGTSRDLTAEAGGERRILISHNLAPSDTAQLNPETVLGFATDVGSKTSHTAIMARSLNIPAVVALHDISLQVETGENLLLDGYTGLIVVNPSEATLREYAEIEQQKGKVELELGTLRETECKTLDGKHVVLSANIEMPRDVTVVRQSGAEGVGLFRTEFFNAPASRLKKSCRGLKSNFLL